MDAGVPDDLLSEVRPSGTASTTPPRSTPTPARTTTPTVSRAKRHNRRRRRRGRRRRCGPSTRTRASHEPQPQPRARARSILRAVDRPRTTSVASAPATRATADAAHAVVAIATAGAVVAAVGRPRPRRPRVRTHPSAPRRASARSGRSQTLWRRGRAPPASSGGSDFSTNPPLPSHGPGPGAAGGHARAHSRGAYDPSFATDARRRSPRGTRTPRTIVLASRGARGRGDHLPLARAGATAVRGGPRRSRAPAAAAAHASSVPGDPKARPDALRSARGAIVRVGVGGGQYQVAELAGGAIPPASDGPGAGRGSRVSNPRSRRSRFRATPSLGVVSNTPPSRHEWDAYVDACVVGYKSGTDPPPLVSPTRLFAIRSTGRFAAITEARGAATCPRPETVEEAHRRKDGRGGGVAAQGGWDPRDHARDHRGTAGTARRDPRGRSPPPPARDPRGRSPPPPARDFADRPGPGQGPGPVGTAASRSRDAARDRVGRVAEPGGRRGIDPPRATRARLTTTATLAIRTRHRTIGTLASPCGSWTRLGITGWSWARRAPRRSASRRRRGAPGSSANPTEPPWFCRARRWRWVSRASRWSDCCASEASRSGGGREGRGARLAFQIEGPEGFPDFVGEGAGAGGDLRGQLKRGRDARVATEVDEGSRKHRKGPDDAFEDAGGAIEGSKNGGSG